MYEIKMPELKTIAERILSDILESKPIADILLKAQIFASKKNDKVLLDWVLKELNGYEDAPPSYRILDAEVKVFVYVPYHGTRETTFPAELIPDKRISERLSKIPFHQPIHQLDVLTHSGDHKELLAIRIPVEVYHFMAPFINAKIQNAYQYVPKSSAQNIIISVKSLLIDYFLKISKEDYIDFETLFNKERKENTMAKNITNNYNGGIINIGDGTVTAPDSNIVVGDNNKIIQEAKQTLQGILEEIEKNTVQNQDRATNDAIADIKAELQKMQPDFSKVKMLFSTIGNFILGTASGVAANGLTPLVQQAQNLIATLM